MLQARRRSREGAPRHGDGSRCDSHPTVRSIRCTGAGGSIFALRIPRKRKRESSSDLSAGSHRVGEAAALLDAAGRRWKTIIHERFLGGLLERTSLCSPPPSRSPPPSGSPSPRGDPYQGTLEEGRTIRPSVGSSLL